MDPDGGVTGESWQWARTTTPAALTYALSGTDAASFAIDSDTGQLMTLAALDYETKATYSVTVTASDSGGLSDSIDVTITVMMDSWMDIAGETNAAYTVTEGDTGYYLRVMATYTDAVGTDTAMEYSMPTMMVTAVRRVLAVGQDHDTGHDGQLDGHRRRNQRRVHGDGRRHGLLPAGDGYVHGRGGHGHGHGVLDVDHDGDRRGRDDG
jgi:hypothetical protein